MITIRQAVLSDKPQIFAFLREAYPDRWQYKIPTRWKWAFEDNPYRKPDEIPIWIALAEGGKVVGQSCALVEPIWIEGKVQRVGWGIDFRVLPAYRGHGLGTQLQKSNNSAHPLFMSLSMAMAARKIKTAIGMQPLSPVPVFLKIIHHDPASVQKTLMRRLSNALQLPINFPATLLSNLLSGGLSWRDAIRDQRRIPKPAPDIDLIQIEHFGEAFDQLFSTIAPKFKALVRRDAVYLNWKFKQQPHMNHFAILAQRAGQPCGYLILRRSQPPERNVGVLVDLFASPDDISLIDTLIGKAVAFFRKHNVTYISAASSVPAYQKRLSALGFKRINTTSPMIRSHINYPKTGWLLSKGDHDWDQYPLA